MLLLLKLLQVLADAAARQLSLPAQHAWPHCQ
jgi:hypothetical protein